MLYTLLQLYINFLQIGWNAHELSELAHADIMTLTVGEICMHQGAIVASRDAAGPFLRCEPMTPKSCAPGLPNSWPVT